MEVCGRGGEEEERAPRPSRVNGGCPCGVRMRACMHVCACVCLPVWSAHEGVHARAQEKDQHSQHRWTRVKGRGVRMQV